MGIEDDLQEIKQTLELLIEASIRDIPEKKRCYRCRGLGSIRLFSNGTVERCDNCYGTGREKVPNA